MIFILSCYLHGSKKQSGPEVNEVLFPFLSYIVNVFPFFLKILRMNNERFAVPELLFHPSDIGKESKTKLAANMY